MSTSQLPLAGQTAFVSGSTAGIGMAIVQALLADGARVILNGRQPQAVHAAVSRLREQDSQADVTGIAADLGTTAGCEQVAPLLANADILVNNLGIFEPRPFGQITDAECCAGTAVTVNSVLPGPTLTEGARAFFDTLPWPSSRASASTKPRPASSAKRGPPRCCAASSAPTRSPRWWLTSAARRPAPPPVPRCGSTVAWCARSPEPFCFFPGVKP